MLMGNNNDDLMDDDYDAQMNPNLASNRPSTVGAGYNTRSATQQQQPLLTGKNQIHTYILTYIHTYIHLTNNYIKALPRVTGATLVTDPLTPLANR